MGRQDHALGVQVMVVSRGLAAPHHPCACSALALVLSTPRHQATHPPLSQLVWELMGDHTPSSLGQSQMLCPIGLVEGETTELQPSRVVKRIRGRRDADGGLWHLLALSSCLQPRWYPHRALRQGHDSFCCVGWLSPALTVAGVRTDPEFFQRDVLARGCKPWLLLWHLSRWL